MAGTTNFKGITIQLDIDSNDFDSKLKKSNRAVDDFDRQLKKLDDALKLNPNNLDAIASKFDLVGQKSIQLENNVKQFEKALQDLKDDNVERTDKRFIDVVSSLQKARSELAKYNEEMARLEKVNVEDIHLFYGGSGFEARYDRLTGILSNYENKIKDVNDAIKKSGSSYDLMNTKTKLTEEYQKALAHYMQELERVMQKMREKGIKPTSDDYVKYSTELANTRGKLNELREAELKAKLSTSELGEEVKNTSNEVNSAKSSIDKFAGNLTSAENGLKQLSDSLKKAADGFKWLSSVSAVALGGSAKVSISFEDAFASVKKTVDETKNISYEDLSESIREMATTLPSSANEIAEIVSLAGQLGVKTEDVTRFSKAMIDLGNSTNLTSEEAGTMIAQFFNVMKEDTRNVDKFGSALVWLGNNSATTEKDIMELAFRLGGASSVLGFTESQVLALSTALASAGLKAESAGGSISSVMQGIQKVVSGVDEQAGSKLEAISSLLGMSGSEFKKAWGENTYETFTKIIGALGRLKDDDGDLISIMDEMGIKSIRQTDSMSRLTQAYELLDYYTKNANEQFELGTALQDEANKRYDTTASKLKILGNNVKETGIELGELLLPNIRHLITGANNTIKSLKKWVSNNKTLTATILTFTSALSPALLIGSKITGLLSQTILPAIRGLVVGFASLNPAVILGTVAFAGLTTALIGFSKRVNSDSYQMLVSAKETTQAFRDNRQAVKEYYEEIDSNTNAKLSELDYYSSLAEELGTLYEKNGKVKEGYEDRAEYIINTLVNAGIIEREDLEKSIKKNEDYTTAINKSIEALEAQAIMEANQDKFTQALKDRNEAQQWFIDNAHLIADADRILADKSTAYYQTTWDGKKVTQDYLEMLDQIQTQESIMNEQFETSNLIISNTEKMREAYENGDWETVIKTYNNGMIEAYTEGTDEVEEKQKEFLERMKALNEMTSEEHGALYENVLKDTKQGFADLVGDASLAEKSLDEIIGRMKQKSASMRADMYYTLPYGIKTGANSNYRIPNGGRYNNSGGFASGGITSNVTINVNNNGKSITASEVRRWASIINDELGGSF